MTDDVEQERLAELARLAILDSPEERAYDDITRLAASVCGAPIALISLIDSERQWFKSRVGMQVSETPRESSFCAVAIQASQDTFVVKDASQDPRFATNPLVTGDPNIRFYAGSPLVTAAGRAIGTLCVIDKLPRELDRKQLEELRFLAKQVVAMLEARAQSVVDAP